MRAHSARCYASSASLWPGGPDWGDSRLGSPIELLAVFIAFVVLFERIRPKAPKTPRSGEDVFFYSTGIK